MKNSKEYSKKISSLYQSLKRKHPKVSAKLPDGHNAGSSHGQVVDSVIYGIICEKLSEKDARAALKRFSEYFVDWNDLRVSRLEEIAEMLGSDNPENRQIAAALTKVLQKIFNESHQISLESLQKLGKRQARQKLEKLLEYDGSGPGFVTDYCMLVSLASHAIPLTQKMIEYLKGNELVDQDSDEKEIEGFLSKQISAKNGYEFYTLLRHESETEKIPVIHSNSAKHHANEEAAEQKKKKKTSKKKEKETKNKTKKK
ncbi:MAG: hypothetical protein JW787_18835 [Sedimentisphaerales bacterium]|nr:hypothetical protein [Sedimentisphaerales bacterium]